MLETLCDGLPLSAVDGEEEAVSGPRFIVLVVGPAAPAAVEGHRQRLGHDTLTDRLMRVQRSRLGVGDHPGLDLGVAVLQQVNPGAEVCGLGEQQPTSELAQHRLTHAEVALVQCYPDVRYPQVELGAPGE